MLSSHSRGMIQTCFSRKRKLFKITGLILFGTRWKNIIIFYFTKCYQIIIWSSSYLCLQIYSIDVNYPDVAHLTFRVMDSNDASRDKLIAFASIPVHALRNGFRNVPLFTEQGTRLGEMFYASLFIRISVSTAGSNNNSLMSRPISVSKKG